MDRREFLKKAGVGAAALGVGACAPGSLKGGSDNKETTSPSGTMVCNYEGVGLLGYGCMRWPQVKGDDGKNHIDQDAVNSLVDYALEHGVNYFDTSPIYLEGDSERATAEALNRHPREKWLLATKLSNFGDASYDNSVKMYRKSLEIFKTDYVDYYLLHSVSGGADFNNRFGDTGIMDFLLEERRKGHIRNLGFSFHGPDNGFRELMALHEKYHWDFVQIQMNYLDWTHSGANNASAKFLYGELDSREIPIIIMEPLRGGRLADLPAALADMLKSREPQKSLASWAFRFAGSFPRVKCILSGMTYMNHLQDNLDTFLDFKPLTDEEKDLLELTADQMEKYPLVRCTSCQYCMPCPYGINIPAIFRFYNDNVNAGTYVVNKEQEGYAKARRRYLLAYDKAIPSVRQADHCISCGRCSKACPQHIAIPRELRRIDAYIESLKREEL